MYNIEQIRKLLQTHFFQLNWLKNMYKKHHKKFLNGHGVAQYV